MSDKEQRDVVAKSVGLAACAVAVSVAMPAMSVRYDDKRDEADLRNDAIQLANAEAASEIVRQSPHSPALLDHPWMVKVEYALERDPRSALSRYSMRDRDGAALQSVASFQQRHFNRAETVASEFQCMAEAVYYEARSEKTAGQIAVAEVIANRVSDHRYPNSVCDVVYQGSTRSTGCQFTFTCDGAMDTKPRGEKWDRAKLVASHVMMDMNEKRLAGATHYHATYVNPVWNSGLVKTNKIGAHIFYRFPRGGEWTRVNKAMAARRAGTRHITTVSDQVAESKPLTTITAAPAP